MNEQLSELLANLPAYLGGHVLLSMTALAAAAAVSLVCLGKLGFENAYAVAITEERAAGGQAPNAGNVGRQGPADISAEARLPLPRPPRCSRSSSAKREDIQTSARRAATRTGSCRPPTARRG